MYSLKPKKPFPTCSTWASRQVQHAVQEMLTLQEYLISPQILVGSEFTQSSVFSVFEIHSCLSLWCFCIFHGIVQYLGMSIIDKNLYRDISIRCMRITNAPYLLRNIMKYRYTITPLSVFWGFFSWLLLGISSTSLLYHYKSVSHSGKKVTTALQFYHVEWIYSNRQKLSWLLSLFKV